MSLENSSFACLEALERGQIVLPQNPSTAVHHQMAPKRRVPTEFLQQYLSLIAGEAQLDPEARLLESLSHHAELNFKLNGGLHCPVCNAHVRHVIQVEVERNGITQMFSCLCTRC